MLENFRAVYAGELSRCRRPDADSRCCDKACHSHDYMYSVINVACNYGKEDNNTCLMWCYDLLATGPPCANRRQTG